MNILGVSDPYAPTQVNKTTGYINVINNRFKSENELFNNLDLTTPNLFTTNVTDDEVKLAYLTGFPENDRQVHNCRTCLHFLIYIGKLVHIDSTGDTVSVLREVLNEMHHTAESYAALTAVAELAESNVVVSHFDIDRETARSFPQVRNYFGHMGLSNPEDYPVSTGEMVDKWNKSYAALQRAVNELTRNDLAAFKKEWDVKVDSTGNNKFSILLTDFIKLHKTITETMDYQTRNNLINYHAAMTATSVTQLFTSVLGNFITDVVNSGKPFDTAMLAFYKQTDPENYKRSSRLVSMGAIKAADKVFTEKGYYKSLDHRLLTINDLTEDHMGKSYWSYAKEKDLGIKNERTFLDMFDQRDRDLYNVNKGKNPVVETDMERFINFIKQSNVSRIQLHLKNTMVGSSVLYFATKENIDAPNILNYHPNKGPATTPFILVNDSLGGNYYFATNNINKYMGFKYGGLDNGEIVDILSINRPILTSYCEHLNPKDNLGVIFLFAGKPNHPLKCNNPIFPDSLIPELYPHRATIEEYNRANQIEHESPDPLLLGLSVNSGGTFKDMVFTVTYLDGAETLRKDFVISNWYDSLVPSETKEQLLK